MAVKSVKSGDVGFPENHVVLLSGPPGAGKSKLAENFSDWFQQVHKDTIKTTISVNISFLTKANEIQPWEKEKGDVASVLACRALFACFPALLELASSSKNPELFFKRYLNSGIQLRDVVSVAAVSANSDLCDGDTVGVIIVLDEAQYLLEKSLHSYVNAWLNAVLV